MKKEYKDLVSDCVIEIINIEQFVNSQPFDSKNKFLQKYIVLKCSGTIETIFKHLIFDKLTTNTQKITSNYIENTVLRNSTNVNFDNICSLLEKISRNWSALFKKEFPKLEKESKGLDTLIQNRNKIAHGANITVPSILETKNSFYSACKILIWIDKVLTNQNS